MDASRPAFLAACLLLASTLSFAQMPGGQAPRFSIEGRVMGVDGKPLSLVIVTLQSFSGMQRAQVTTDAGGHYAFHGLERGSYYVHASKPGYTEAREAVELVIGSQHGVILQLAPVERLASRPPGGVAPAIELMVPEAARKDLEAGIRQLKERENAKNALQHFRRAVSRHASYAPAYYWIGMAHLELGEPQEARAAFERALELNDKLGPAYIALGTIHLDANELPEAIRLLEAGQKFAPNDWQAHYELGRAQLSLRRLAEAEKNILRAQELNPDLSRTHLLLAMIYYTGGQLEKSLEAAEKYLQAPDDEKLAEQVRQQAEQIRNRIAAQ